MITENLICKLEAQDRIPAPLLPYWETTNESQNFSPCLPSRALGSGRHEHTLGTEQH